MNDLNILVQSGPIWEHQSQANHEIDWEGEGVQILDKESVEIIRKIKEAN